MVLSKGEYIGQANVASEVLEFWEVIKADYKGQAELERKRVKKLDTLGKFKEARRVRQEYQDAFELMRWEQCFRCTHLYLNIALDGALHKQSGKFANEAKVVLGHLKNTEQELDYAMRGIKSMVEEKKYREYVASNAPKPAAVGEISQETEEQPKRYSLEQAMSALDALRIDGKRTNSLKLYGMDIAKPSPAPHIPTPVVTPLPLPPPPSYQEAVSAARILNTSSSSRKVETGFRVKRVMGDGSCAFRSIAQGTANGELDSQSELRIANKLRGAAVEELRRCASEEMTGTGLTVEQLVLIKDEKFPTFNEYCQAMSRYEYAGETEFWLLSRKLELNIAIYKPQDAGYEHMITYGNYSGDTVKLLWQRGQTEAGNHYDCLL